MNKNNDDFFKDLLGEDNSFVLTKSKEQKRKIDTAKFIEEGQGAFSPNMGDKTIEIKDIEETALNDFIGEDA
jgi:hypothetical protein